MTEADASSAGGPARSPAEREGRHRIASLIAVAVGCAGHVALSAALLRGALFDKYPDAARLFRLGKLRAEEVTDFSPLYLVFNLLFEPSFLRWIQLLGTASVPIAVYLFGRRFFGPVRAAGAALLAAFSVSLLIHGAALEPDAWIAVAAAWALVLLEALSRRPKMAVAVGAAMVCGAACALRPTNALWVVPGVLWALWPLRRKVRELLPIAAALLFVGAACALLPSAYIRSGSAQGSELTATMSVGAVLHMGNRPESPGVGANPPLLLKLYELQHRSKQRPDFAHSLYRQFGGISAGTAQSGASAELHWIDRTLTFARLEPMAFVGLWMRKAVFFVVGPEAHDLFQVRQAERTLRSIPLVTTPLLFALALVGLVQLAWSRKGALLAIQLAAFAGMCVVFYVVSRYRVAAIAPAALCAAAAIPELSLKPRVVRWVAAGLCLALALGAMQLGFVSAASRVLARAEVATEAGALLDRALNAGQLDGATAAFVEAQAAQPAIEIARNLRGIAFESPRLAMQSGARSVEQFGVETPADSYVASVLAAKAGQCDAALAGAELVQSAGYAWAIFDTLVEPGLASIPCLLSVGGVEKAREAARGALRMRPGSADALAALIAANAASTQPDGDEVARAEATLDALHDKASVQYAKARWFNTFGSGSGALAASEELLRMLPDAAVGHYERAVALAALGQPKDAVLAFDRAVSLFPSHAFRAAPLDAAVQATLVAEPQNALIAAIAAEHAFRRGDVAGARSLAEHSARLNGGAPIAEYADRGRSYFR